jgi:hypothetical protein
MDVPTLEVGYTSATTGKGNHEVHKGHVVALGGGGKKRKNTKLGRREQQGELPTFSHIPLKVCNFQPKTHWISTGNACKHSLVGSGVKEF